MTCAHGQATVDETRFSISIEEREPCGGASVTAPRVDRGSLPQASQSPAKTIQVTGVMPGSYEKGNV